MVNDNVRLDKWLEDSGQEAAVQNWKEIYQDAFLYLLDANIPFYHYLYLPERFRKNRNIAAIQLSDVKYQPGIILDQIRYIDHTDNDSLKTKWLTEKGWKNKHGERSLVSHCQWTLRPLSITAKARSLDPKEQYFHYKMIAVMYDKKTEKSGGYAAWITTGWDGRLVIVNAINNCTCNFRE